MIKGHMRTLTRFEPLILFLGDILLFYFALWLTLWVRYAEMPGWGIWSQHFVPFTLIFALWVLVFFIAGLYEKHTLILKSKLPAVILRVQVTNSALAVLFFYLVPFFGIAPKTNLFIHLGISFGLVLAWRIYGTQIFGFRRREPALLIGSGEEMKELRDEVNGNRRYGLTFVSSVDLDKVDGLDFDTEVLERVYSEGITSVVVDLKNEKVGPILPKLYNLIFSNVKFLDQYKVYEDIFDRVPLSLVGYNWFLENISFAARSAYDVLKRAMDIVGALIGLLVSLPLYPFIGLAIKFEDGGPVFFSATRVGKDNRTFRIVKFRSMSPESRGGGIEEKPHVTRVGAFLRKVRLDELPQLWSVFKGDLSLIGPRPEYPDLVKLYEREIPYYNVRHLIKPGLSGWAQLYHDAHPHHGPDVTETKRKLSYDLYYIKNRSFALDMKIALKTIKTVLSRSGV